MAKHLITIKSIMHHTGLSVYAARRMLNELGITGKPANLPYSCKVAYPKDTIERIKEYRKSRGLE